MDRYYKRLFRNILLGMVVIFAGITYIVYQAFTDYAIVENKAKLQDLLMHNKALHYYVEDTLKPIIYDFQDKGLVSKSYFNPEILSITYISRQIMQKYNEERESSGLEKYIYKIASDNPRNPINQANKEESELLKKFNDTNLTSFSKEMMINHKKYIYYAVPIKRNQKSCMRCHSSPKIAPVGLLKMYGTKSGFDEVLGKSRAIVSLAIPLEEDMNKMTHLFRYILISLGIIFIIVSIIIYFLIRRLSHKDHILQNRVRHDALTNVLNRYKFDRDIAKFTASKRDETLYLIMFDIDHFKKINDTYGHPQGDVILKELCDVISSHIRPTDRFYRIGGEEFAIFSFGNTKEQTIEFANRIKKIVKEHNFDTIKNLTISIGVTQFIAKESLTIFYKRCDKALYNAKENGRNRVEFL